MGAFKIVRGIFVFFNLLFMLLGLAVTGVGVYIQVSRGDYMKLLPDYDVLSAGGLLIGAGIVVIFVSALGFVGALMSNQCILGFYFFCVLVIFCLEVTAGVLGFIYKGDVSNELETQLLLSIDQKEDETKYDTDTRAVWDAVQEEFKCCGVMNYTDWYGKMDIENTNSLPESCCQQTCKGRIDSDRKGCYKSLKDWFIENYQILGIVGIVVGVVQILMLIAAAVLICFIRKEKLIV